MARLFLICLFLVFVNANTQPSENNDYYPPMWDIIPDNLSDVSENGTVVLQPWIYQQRMLMYKVMLNATAPYLNMKEQDNLRNILWGLAMQNGWQYSTDRLRIDTEPCASETKNQTCISVRSWWACMNYFLSVIPFLGAMDAGLFNTYDIQISPPKEFQSDFCYSIAECHSFVSQALDSWQTFFKIIKTSDIAEPQLSKAEDWFLTYMWKAHVESISAGLPRCSKRLQYLSLPERTFGKDWGTTVEFLAATNFPTNFQSTHEFQAFLPPRKLVNGDKAPFITDFTEEQNRVLVALRTINSGNTLTVTCRDPSVRIIKYADDTTLVGLINDNNESAYRNQVKTLESWCKADNLILNIQKMVKVIIDFRRAPKMHHPILIGEEEVKIVTNATFLGTQLSQDL
ncbi:protein LEG1 homolog [Gastrophryne carolinensis]